MRERTDLDLQIVEKDESMTIVDEERNRELDKEMKHYFSNGMNLWNYMEKNVWSKAVN